MKEQKERILVSVCGSVVLSPRSVLLCWGLLFCVCTDWTPHWSTSQTWSVSAVTSASSSTVTPSHLSPLWSWTTNRRSTSGYTMRWSGGTAAKLCWIITFLKLKLTLAGTFSVLLGVGDGDGGGSGHPDEQRCLLCYTVHKVHHVLEGTDRLAVQRRQDGRCHMLFWSQGLTFVSIGFSSNSLRNK